MRAMIADGRYRFTIRPTEACSWVITVGGGRSILAGQAPGRNPAMEAGAASPDPAGKPRRFSIRVDGAADAFACDADTPVLIAMERSGRKAIAVGCRGGGCGTCRVWVRAGSYRTGRMSRGHVTVEEERQGYARACKLFPLEDLLLMPARRMPGQAPQL